MTDAERAEYDSIVQRLTETLQQVAAERDQLRLEKSDALSVLKEAYNDPNVPPALRIKAAGLALPHETPRLTPIAPVLELTAKPIEPLADLVARRRRRQAAVEGMALDDPRLLQWVERENGTYPAEDDPGDSNKS